MTSVSTHNPPRNWSLALGHKRRDSHALAGKFRPIIGVTGPDRGGAAAWTLTRLNVWLAGGKALRITPSSPRSIYEIDALIIGGGADLDSKPHSQGREILDESTQGDPHQPWQLTFLTWLLSPLILLLRKVDSLSEVTITPDRDELEGDLLALAVERDMPVLGICRGSQFINVHFGGTLLQGVESFYSDELKSDSVYPRKKVYFQPQSQLSRVLRRDWCRVNSLCNHSDDDLGEGIAIVACDDQGVIQAIEHQEHTFIIGVQWHPEYLIQLPEQHRIFEQLVLEAQTFSGTSLYLPFGNKRHLPSKSLPRKELSRQALANPA